MKVGEMFQDSKGRIFRLEQITEERSCLLECLEESQAAVGDSVNVPLAPRIAGQPLGNVRFERIK